MSFNKIRERINLKLYGSKERVLKALRIVNLLVSISAIATLIYLYGFQHSTAEQDSLLHIIKASFIFYICQYVIRFLYDFHPKQFLQNTWIEGSIMLFLLIEGISYNFFDVLLIEEIFQRMGISSFTDVTTFFIQGYFFIVVFLELKRSSTLFPKIKLHPAVVFMMSFLFIILAGTGLLMLPEMSQPTIDLGFTDAFFMSTSATCVTGLGVVEMTDFTYKGQVIILILIKLGGLNIIAFGFIFILMNKIGLGVKQDSLVEDFVNTDAVHNTRSVLKKIVFWSLGIELLGALILFPLWGVGDFQTIGDQVFSSIFHSVSAFNNAGLSLFEGGLYNEMVRDNYLVHLVITILVFFGALGFVAIFNLLDPKSLRDRMKYPWKQISFSTKIALYFSLIFVVIGTVGFYFLEYNNTLVGKNFGESMITSLFQSVTRTSGFSTVDFNASDGFGLSVPFLILMLFLMFVGSSSSSTGGGIKTSTFAIIWASFTKTIRGKKYPAIFKRTISQDLIGKAFAVLLIFIGGNLICIFALSITESEILAAQGRTILDLVFEEVSAFGTVGLSTGITSDLTDAGKYIIVISMFVGRVGTLTVAYLFGKKLLSRNYKYPSGHTMVG
jgi:trk system potassium uptake protein